MIDRAKYNLTCLDNSFASNSKLPSQYGFLCIATVQICRQGLYLPLCYISVPINLPQNLESSWLKTLVWLFRIRNTIGSIILEHCDWVVFFINKVKYLTTLVQVKISEENLTEGKKLRFLNDERTMTAIKIH